jgi:ABC-type multidrug transport system fused ATPase/permease subunit
MVSMIILNPIIVIFVII